MWRIKGYAPVLSCMDLTGNMPSPASDDAAVRAATFRNLSVSLLVSPNAPKTSGMGPPVRNVLEAFSNGPVKPSASWANWASHFFVLVVYSCWVWQPCLSVPLVDPTGWQGQMLEKCHFHPCASHTYWVVVDEE
eukprot:5498848-Ditylum_brightwellii.AAC.1